MQRPLEWIVFGAVYYWTLAKTLAKVIPKTLAKEIRPYLSPESARKEINRLKRIGDN